jgi:hypothetical protein
LLSSSLEFNDEERKHETRDNVERVTRSSFLNTPVAPTRRWWRSGHPLENEAILQLPYVFEANDLLAFLNELGDMASGFSDAALEQFEAYDSQALSRLGYPGTFDCPVKALFKFPELEDDELLPAPIDRFDARAMPDIHGFVFSSGERLRFTYVDSFSPLD